MTFSSLAQSWSTSVGHCAHDTDNHNFNPFLLWLPFLGELSSGSELRGCSSVLHIEQELDDIAVLHDILLALGALQALGLDGSVIEIVGLEVAVGDDAGADEAALKVAVDLAGSLRSLGTLADGPGTALLLAVGQEGDEPSRS